MSLNGGSNVAVSDDQNWREIATGSGTLNTLDFICDPGNSMYLAGIRIDSTTILLDPVVPKADAAATTFNPFTTDINTVRGQEGAYATFNPLDKNSGATLSNGNLKIQTTTNVWKNTPTSIGMKTGKFYCEFGPNLWSDSNNHCQPGVRAMGLGNTFEMGAANYTAFYHYTGTSFFNGQGGAGTAFGAAWNDNSYNTIGIAFDADTRKVWFSKNGMWQGGGNPSAGTNEAGIISLYGDGTYAFCLGTHGNGGLPSGGAEANFGQKPFKYAPPDGFQPLNLSNVQPEKVIARPDQYVDVSLWSGNGTSQSITGLKHKPDFVWIKKRAGGTARSHQLFDSVRGVHKTLHSDSTNGEDTNTSRLTAFNQDGFTVGGDDGSNGSSGEFVAWTWKAGGNKNTFNIDDVGYANASDVNMNVGALNSSLYNTSRVWSSAIANPGNNFDQPATNAFNGDRSNKLRTGGNAVLVTMNFSPALTVANTIQLLGEDYATANFRYTVTVDGTTTTKDVDQGQPATFNVSGSLTQITFVNNNSNGRTYLEWIKVDGNELIDSNVTINTPSIAATGSSVGTKQGFSIVSYTGAGGSTASIPHGLEQSPDFVIIKNRDGGTSGSAGGWYSIYHDGFTYNHMYGFNNVSSSDSAWNNHGQITGTTSNLVQVANGDHSSANNWWTHNNGSDYIMYSWHNVPGLQKFGTYTGNGSSDGPFIELGFKPAIFWMKAATSTGNWIIIDNKRPGYNPDQKTLCPNLSNAENASGGTTNDMLSNGFKVRGTTDRNASNVTYIYCAWAEAPSINLYGAQSNAR